VKNGINLAAKGPFRGWRGLGKSDGQKRGVRCINGHEGPKAQKEEGAVDTRTLVAKEGEWGTLNKYTKADF